MKVILFSVVLLYVVYFCYCQQGTLIPLTNAEKQQLVDIHNQLRSEVNAVNMPNVVYVNGLEIWANWSQNCIFDHTTQTKRSNVAGFSYVGENLAASSVLSPLDLFAGVWGDEKKQYVYRPISAANFAPTAHYTQQIWANTIAIGCARINCTGVKNSSGNNFILACNYGPGGNFPNQYPYQQCNASNGCPLLSGSPGATPLTQASGSASISASRPASNSGSISVSNSVSNSRAPSTTSSATPTTTRSITANPSTSPSTTNTASAAARSATSTNTLTATNSISLSSSKSASNLPSVTSSISASGTVSLSNRASTSNAASLSSAASVSNAASVTASPSPQPSCVPATCGTNSCGTLPTGCNGGSVQCGNCPNGTCINNQCSACTPSTTCGYKNCGQVYDSTCQVLQNCGTCTGNRTCQNGYCLATSACPSSCASLGYQCGSVVPQNCTMVLFCGLCPSGSSCLTGQCVSTACSTNCSRPNYSCQNGTCVCNPGYNDKQDGNGCTPSLTVPYGFTEIDVNNRFITPVNWVLSANAVTGNPQLDVLNNTNGQNVTNGGPTYRLSWDNAAQFSSLTRTTFQADIEFNAGNAVGLGLRLGQGAGRETDAIQWTLRIISPNVVGLTWEVVWRNVLYSFRDNMFNPNTNTSWVGFNGGRSSFHTVKFVSQNTQIAGVMYQVSQIYVDGVALDNPETVRPYDMLGGAYLYTFGPTPAFKNLALFTAQTVYVSVQNCISASQLADMVSGALNVTITNINVTSTNDGAGRCTQQAGSYTAQASGAQNKRQAGPVVVPAIAPQFSTTFLVELSSDVVVAQSLVSKFMELGLSWNPVFAQTGGILSIEPAPIPDLTAELGIVNPIDLETYVPGVPVAPPAVPFVAPAAAAGGLTAGAKAGIVIGSVVGGVAILAALVVAAVVAGVVIKSKITRSKIVVEPVSDTEMGTVTSAAVIEEQQPKVAEETSAEPRKKISGVNVFDLDPSRHQSITGRLEGRSAYKHVSSVFDSSSTNSL